MKDYIMTEKGIQKQLDHLDITSLQREELIKNGLKSWMTQQEQKQVQGV